MKIGTIALIGAGVLAFFLFNDKSEALTSMGSSASRGQSFVVDSEGNPAEVVYPLQPSDKVKVLGVDESGARLVTGTTAKEILPQLSGLSPENTLTTLAKSFPQSMANYLNVASGTINVTPSTRDSSGMTSVDTKVRASSNFIGSKYTSGGI